MSRVGATQMSIAAHSRNSNLRDYERHSIFASDVVAPTKSIRLPLLVHAVRISISHRIGF